MFAASPGGVHALADQNCCQEKISESPSCYFRGHVTDLEVLTSVAWCRLLRCFGCPRVMRHSFKIGRRRFAGRFGCIEHLSALHDVGQQNIDKWMLAVKGCAALVLGNDDPLDRGEIAPGEGVVLRAQ